MTSRFYSGRVTACTVKPVAHLATYGLRALGIPCDLQPRKGHLVGALFLATGHKSSQAMIERACKVLDSSVQQMLDNLPFYSVCTKLRTKNSSLCSTTTSVT